MHRNYRRVALCLSLGMILGLAGGANAALLYNQNVTQGPGDLYYGGAGNNNGGFTVFRSDGLELGLRAHTRFPAPSDTDSASVGLMNQGNGLYGSFAAGEFGSGNNRASWNFDFSINTHYDQLGGPTLAGSGLTFKLFIDYDPTLAGVSLGSSINALTAFNDNGYGTNLGPTGDGTTALDSAALQASSNVVQNSENVGFGFVVPAFDLNAPGYYDIVLAAFSGDNEVGRTQITVGVTTPEPASLTLWGLGALGCAIAGYRRRKLA